MKKINVLLLLFVFCSLGSLGQSPAIEKIPLCTDCLDSLANTFWNKGESSPPKKTGKTVTKHLIDLKKSEGFIFFAGDSEKTQLQVINNNDTTTYYGGRFQPDKMLESRHARVFIPIQLKAGFNTLIATSENLSPVMYFHEPIIVNGVDTQNAVEYFKDNYLVPSVVNLLVLCALLWFLIYSLFNYFFYKNAYYKYYSQYLIVIIGFFLFILDDVHLTHFLFPHRPELYIVASIALQPLIYVFYTRFVMNFLEFKKLDPIAYKWSIIFQIFVFSVGLLNAVNLYITYNQNLLSQITTKLHLISFAIAVFIMVRVLFYMKGRLRWFIVMGSLAVAVGTMLEYQVLYRNATSATLRSNLEYIPQYLSGFNHLELSFLVEIIIFFFAIGYKTWQKEEVHKQFKEDTIIELSKKKELETEVNKLLSQQLDQSKKDLEIEKLYSENEKTKSNLMMSQLNGLQLQMNPHYLFNSLNSINDIVLSEKPMEASEFLGMYARTMRNTLKNSKETFSSLNSELDFAQDYLDLEQLRFANKFNYKINTPSDPSVLNLKIPSMVLQPVLENAVWHGMMSVKSDGLIEVNTKYSGNILQIIVTDNGAGLKTQVTSPHKSYGLAIVKEKLMLIEKMHGISGSLTITNRENENGVEAVFSFENLKPNS